MVSVEGDPSLTIEYTLQESAGKLFGPVVSDITNPNHLLSVLMFSDPECSLNHVYGEEEMRNLRRSLLTPDDFVSTAKDVVYRLRKQDRIAPSVGACILNLSKDGFWLGVYGPAKCFATYTNATPNDKDELHVPDIRNPNMVLEERVTRVVRWNYGAVFGLRLVAEGQVDHQIIAPCGGPRLAVDVRCADVGAVAIPTQRTRPREHVTGLARL